MFVLFLVVIYAFASMRASRAIHVKLMDTLLASTFRYFGGIMMCSTRLIHTQMVGRHPDVSHRDALYPGHPGRCVVWSRLAIVNIAHILIQLMAKLRNALTGSVSIFAMVPDRFD